MKKKISSRKSTFLFIAGSILLGYFFLYLPITNQLNLALVEKWQLSAKAKSYTLQIALQKDIEGANSISSRSAIRDKICEYKNDLISWETLQDYSHDKYADGAAILENIVFASRIIENQILVTYQTPGKEAILDEVQQLALPLNENQILHLDENVYFLVVSEILKDGECVGNDVLLYDLSPILAELDTDTFSIEILPTATVPAERNESLQKGNNNIVFEEFLPGANSYVRISTKRNEILGDTAKKTDLYLILYSALVVSLYWISNRAFINQTREVINEIEDSKQEFIELAYRDALTNAYSRQFLTNWINQTKNSITVENSPYILVVIDVDRMKSINDTYGHEIGDLVLKKVVEVTTKMIRKEDLIIRIGGDEFLVIFSGIEESIVSTIMKRIETELKMTDIWSIEIGISYGISTLNQIEEIKHSLRQADIKMYDSKKEKPSH